MDETNAIEQLKQLINSSEYLKKIERLKNPAHLFGSPLRSLTGGEISLLEAGGNSSDDWSIIKVPREFSPERIKNSRFMGSCILGAIDKEPIEIEEGLSLKPGIHGSMIAHSVICPGALVYNTNILSNYFVSTGAVLLNNSAILAAGSFNPGNGTLIPIGDETGSREIPLLAEMPLSLAEHFALLRPIDAKLLELIEIYKKRSQMTMGFIGKNSRVKNSITIKNSYIGEGALVNHALLLEDSTLLSTTAEPVSLQYGIWMKQGLIQWGSEITNGASVERTLFTEHSHGEKHAKIADSVIGPNTGIAEGEVTASLVGPFVGFHHQSLLIGACWPEGRGNVAYGANVGSNHTSKAPDQEIFCGEGTFFGLGSNIKFPAHFAPYTIVATGVTTLPQKMEFPFSLINTPSQNLTDISPGFNELIPGWILSDNLFLIFRNEEKYKSRNKARRSAFDFSIFRKDTAEKMAGALERLEQAEEGLAIYRADQIPGMGKNYITGPNRKKGIAAYRFFIKYYLLDQFYRGLKTGSPREDVTLWEKAGLPPMSREEKLKELINVLEQIAGGIYESKAKDDKRGARIIPRYTEIHVTAGNNSFVVKKQKELAAAVCEIKKLLP